MQAPYKNLMLNCHQSGHHPSLIQHLRISVYLVLVIDAPPIGFLNNWCRFICLRCGCSVCAINLIRRGLVLWPRGFLRGGTRATVCIGPRIMGRPVSKIRFGIWCSFISRGYPKRWVGQCALLLKLGGSDYAGNNLLKGTLNGSCKYCRGSGIRGNVLCIFFIDRGSNNSTRQYHKLWFSPQVDNILFRFYLYPQRSC